MAQRPSPAPNAATQPEHAPATPPPRTLSQGIVVASYLLVRMATREAPMAWFQPFFTFRIGGYQLEDIFIPVLLAVMLLFTVGSGASYMWRNRALILREL